MALCFVQNQGNQFNCKGYTYFMSSIVNRMFSMNQSLLGIGLCILWLLGHAGFTFWAGGFEPGTTTANIFVITDTLVSIGLIYLTINLFRRDWN